MKQRKTIDTWEIQGNYGAGWECVTTELTYHAAVAQLRCYSENEPYEHRIKLKREPFDAETAAEQARQLEQERKERMRARLERVKSEANK